MAKIGKYYYCSSCDTPITYPEEGRIIHGNVYMADPEGRSGVIGNNLPVPPVPPVPEPVKEKKVKNVAPKQKQKPPAPFTFTEDDIKETVLCNNCLIQQLRLEDFIKQKYTQPAPRLTTHPPAIPGQGG